MALHASTAIQRRAAAAAELAKTHIPGSSTAVFHALRRAGAVLVRVKEQPERLAITIWVWGGDARDIVAVGDEHRMASVVWDVRHYPAQSRAAAAGWLVRQVARVSLGRRVLARWGLH